MFIYFSLIDIIDIRGWIVSELSFSLSIMPDSLKIQLHSWLLFASLGRSSQLGRIQYIGTAFFIGFFNTSDKLFDVLLQKSNR